MKNIFTLLVLMLTITTFSQKTFEGKAVYFSKQSVDMERFGNRSEAEKKQMMDRMKSFLEKTYTLTFNQNESSWKEDVKLGAPGTNGPSWGMSNGQGSIYKNFKDGELIEDVEQFSKRFKIVEKMEQPQWQMTAETKQIGNYTCYKAVMVKIDNSVDWGRMFGRRGGNNEEEKKDEEVPTIQVTAWFTPQIPVKTGPDVYWGLPGLILELNAGRFTMLCTEIVLNPTEPVKIEKPTKGDEVDREEYNKIIKEKAMELRERFQGRGNNRGGRGF